MQWIQRAGEHAQYMDLQPERNTYDVAVLRRACKEVCFSWAKPAPGGAFEGYSDIAIVTLHAPNGTMYSDEFSSPRRAWSFIMYTMVQGEDQPGCWFGERITIAYGQQTPEWRYPTDPLTNLGRPTDHMLPF